MMVHMAITYEFDVAPHMRRALALRSRRLQRVFYLRRHHGRALFWQIALPACLMFWAALGYGIRTLL